LKLFGLETKIKDKMARIPFSSVNPEYKYSLNAIVLEDAPNIQNCIAQMDKFLVNNLQFLKLSRDSYEAAAKTINQQFEIYSSTRNRIKNIEAEWDRCARRNPNNSPSKCGSKYSKTEAANEQLDLADDKIQSACDSLVDLAGHIFLEHADFERYALWFPSGQVNELYAIEAEKTKGRTATYIKLANQTGVVELLNDIKAKLVHTESRYKSIDENGWYCGTSFLPKYGDFQTPENMY
jgi:hypothetical protein